MPFRLTYFATEYSDSCSLHLWRRGQAARHVAETLVCVMGNAVDGAIHGRTAKESRSSNNGRSSGDGCARSSQASTFNSQLSAALYGPLHMLEVALRNAAD